MTIRLTIPRKLPLLAGIVLTTGLICSGAGADTIYKTIDAQGNVSFSSSPPPPGVDAQEIQLSPGPTPAQQRQSTRQEQKPEAQSNAIPDEESGSTPGDEDENVVEPTEEIQDESVDSGDDDQPVVVDDGYLGEPYRDERLRDGAGDLRNAVPGPEEIQRPAARAR